MRQSPDYSLRPALREDFDFAAAIYINSMRPLMQQLGRWSEEERRAGLRRSFTAADTSIIVVSGRDIGWIQITERDTDYNLAQLQLLDEFCGLGIGTRLIGGLLVRAGLESKTVSLSVIRINRAIALYERLGFRIVDPEATPILDMVWGEVAV